MPRSVLLFKLIKYKNYLLHGKSIYRLHSPFVYEFAANVLKDKRQYYAFDRIEHRRNLLLKRDDEITVQDLGAGSRKHTSNSRKISEITGASAIPAKYGKMLFRTSIHFNLKNILELGSCTGIGSLYLASATGDGNFITLEGDPQLAAITRESLKHFGPESTSMEVITGEFSQTLQQALDKLKTVDLAFIDGNHQKAPTLQYFEAILPYCHEHSILVFDDIYWSKEMASAWEAIKAHPKTRLTIDLFRMGLVFFRHENKEVEHFMLYY